MKRILISAVIICCTLLTACGSSSIGVIGGADGPTAIFVSNGKDAVDKWGITLCAEGVTDNGMTLKIEHTGEGFGGEFSTGSWYSLEINADGEWSSVEPLVDNSVWTSIAYMIKQNDTTEFPVNWENLYGKLKPGHYRLSKEIMYVRSPGDYDKDLYKVDFVIPSDSDKVLNAEFLSEVFLFHRNEIEKIEVIYPGEGDPCGCYVDKDEFFDIAETVKLEPKRRIEKINSNTGVMIIAINGDDERVAVWLDKRGRIGCSQFESASAVTTQYDISTDDYIRLYSFLPEEATAHIPLDNPMKKYIWIIVAVAVVILGLGFVVGLRLNRQEH